MSTTIDQKVVEMRFDNSDFERNTRQSMSTLDKLKVKLHLKGASDGLDEIGKSAKKVDFSGISSGVQEVSAKFSAMQIIGTTALVNLTNSAMEAGKRIVSSISIDQVTAGWDKMGLKMGSVQTLVNSTGKSVEEIEGYLDKLMWYSDETSYSFTDMTTALANMTSTGGDINKLIPMIMGMANATAFAGKGAAEFSRIIYNLNQSYGAGYLQLLDWKSVQLAGANSKQLTEELIKAGEELGTIQKGQVTIGNFNESLKDKWADTKVMERAFGKFATFTEAVYKYVEENGVAASTAIAKLAKDFDYLSVKALKSAQEAKTFKEAMDATKDAASSGWMKIFTDIFGSYDKQVLIWTDLANTLYDVFVEPINRLEEIIRHAFIFKGVDAMWNKLLEGMNLVDSLKDISKQAGITTKSLEEYQNIVDRVWNGDFKNAPNRQGLLEKEGWDYQAVQDLVNLGARDANGVVSSKNSYNGYRLTLQDVIDVELKHNLITAEAMKKQEQGIELTNEERKSIEKLTDATLDNMGLDEEQIRLYHSLQRAANKYGISMDELVKRMRTNNAHDLIFGKKQLDERGFQVYDKDEKAMYEFEGVVQNFGKAISNIAQAIGKAWREIFDPLGSGELYMAIYNLHAFSVRMREATENQKDMEKLTDTFKGLFSILKLIKTVLGAGFRIAWTIFKTVLQTLGYDVLDFTAALGRMITGFQEFITQNEFIIKGIEWLTKTIANGIIFVHNWVKEWLSVHDVVKKVTNFLSDLGKGFGIWWQGLKETDNIPKYIFDGLVNGIKEWGGKAIDAMGQIASFMIEKFKAVFGIHSPSTEMFDAGVNIIKGIGLGIWAMASWLFNIVKELAGSILGIVTNMDLGSIIFATIGVGIIYAITKIVKAVTAITEIAKGWTNFLEDVGHAAKSFARGFEIKMAAEAIRSMAISLGIMVVALAFLATQDVEKMWMGVGILGALAVILGVLVYAASRLKTESKAILQLAVLMIAIGWSLKMMAKGLNSLADIDWAKAWPSILALITMLGGLITISALVTKSEKDLIKLGGLFLGIGVCFWIMAKVTKTLGNMDLGVLTQGTIALGLFVVLVKSLIKSTNLVTTKEKSFAKLGTNLLLIGVCFWLMARVVKTLGKMDTKDFMQGMIGITLFSGLIVGLIAASRLLANGKEKIYKMGTMLLGVAAALLLMAFTAKILSKMDVGAFIKGFAFVTAFSAMTVALVYGLSFINKEKMVKAAGTVMAVAGCIMLLALCAGLISVLDPSKMAIGTAFVGILSVFAYGLIQVSEHARLVSYKSILAIAAVIVALTLCAGLLSLLDASQLAKGTIALGLLMGIAALLVYSMKYLEKFKMPKTKTIVGLIVIAGLLVTLAWGLSQLASGDINSALAVVAAMSALVLGMVGVVYLADKLPTSGFGKLALVLLGIMAFVLIMNLLFSAIQEIQHPESVVETLIGIGLFLVTFIGIINLIDLIGLSWGAIGKGLLVIGAILAGCLAIAGVIGLFIGFKDAIENGLELIATLFEGIAKIVGRTIGALLRTLADDLSYFGTEINKKGGFIDAMKRMDGDVALGVTAFALAVAELTVASLINGLRKLLSMYTFGLFSYTVLASDLNEFAETLSEQNGFLDVFSKYPSSALEGLKKFSDAILVLSASTFINGINKLFDLFYGWLTGNAFSMSSLVDGVTELGKGLNDLIKSFLGDDMYNTVTTINNTDTEDVDTKKIEDRINLFVKVLDAVSESIKKLAEAQGALPRHGGWKATFAGGIDSLSEFAEGFSGLGTSLTTLTNELIKNNFGEKEVGIVSNAASAIKDLASAAGELPSDGGLLGDLTGKTVTLEEFSKQFPKVAGYLVQFAQALTHAEVNGQIVEYDWSEDVSNAVSTASGAVKAMADATEFLNTTGTKIVEEEDKLFGLITLYGETTTTKYVDKVSIEQFAEKFSTIAYAVKTFANILLGNGESVFDGVSGIKSKFGSSDDKKWKESLEDVKTMLPIYTDLIRVITELAKNSKVLVGFDFETGWIQDMNGIGQKTSHVLSGVKTEDAFINLASSLEKLAPALHDLIDTFLSDDYAFLDDSGDKYEKAKSRMDKAGEIFKTFNEKFQITNTKSDIIKTMFLMSQWSAFSSTPVDFTYLKKVIKELYNFVESEELKNIDIDNLQVRLSQLGNILYIFKNNLTGDSYKPLKEFLDGFKNIGENAFDNLKNGFIDAIKSDNAFKLLHDGLLDFFKGIVNDLEKFKVGNDPEVNVKAKGEELGKSLLEGYINGLANSTLLQKIYTNAKSISQKAVQGIADGQNSNSPSKESMQLGNYLDQGFIIGINELKDKVYDSSFGIGRVATSGLSNSISRIADMVNSDIDANPTIRPVLDLSNVQDGANAINSMFANPSVGLLNNLSSIGYGMNSRIQNGGNNEVVSAIDKLSRTLSNNPSNTYNINGISYNDDSNINNAVRDLINAIEVERRM